MLRIGHIGLLLITLTLTACNPFSQAQDDNQFVVQKKQLVFMGHKLGHWKGKAIPQCMLCSLNVYTIKLSSEVMLFKQINDERGDLFFLAAREVKHSFGLKTGVYSYPMVIKVVEEKASISVDQQEPIILAVDQKQKVILGGNTYFIELQYIDNQYGSVDLNIWSENAI